MGELFFAFCRKIYGSFDANCDQKVKIFGLSYQLFVLLFFIFYFLKNLKMCVCTVRYIHLSTFSLFFFFFSHFYSNPLTIRRPCDI